MALAVTAMGQQARFVDEYAQQPRVDGAETIYLLAVATGELDVTTPFSLDVAEQAAGERTRHLADRDTLTLSELAFLISSHLDIRTGLMNTLFPGPRYALRDLRRERVILYDVDAASPVPGEVALRTIRRALEWRSE